jgi:hypothetical protein
MALSSNTSSKNSSWEQCTPDDVNWDFPSTIDGSHTDDTPQKHQAAVNLKVLSK